jgi:hypothetical protein
MGNFYKKISAGLHVQLSPWPWALPELGLHSALPHTGPYSSKDAASSFTLHIINGKNDDTIECIRRTGTKQAKHKCMNGMNSVGASHL